MMINTRFLALAVISLSLSLQSSAAITDEERSAAVSYFEETRDDFLEIARSVPEEEFQSRPSPERWSLAEITEHLIKAENLIYDLIDSRLLKSEPHPEWLNDGQPLLRDRVIRMALTNRYAERFKAPEVLTPGEVHMSREEWLTQWVTARNRTIELARTTDADLRVLFLQNQGLGMLDGYQWLLFISAHTERHILQAKEVVEQTE